MRSTRRVSRRRRRQDSQRRAASASKSCSRSMGRRDACSCSSGRRRASRRRRCCPLSSRRRSMRCRSRSACAGARARTSSSGPCTGQSCCSARQSSIAKFSACAPASIRAGIAFTRRVRCRLPAPRNISKRWRRRTSSRTSPTDANESAAERPGSRRRSAAMLSSKTRCSMKSRRWSNGRCRCSAVSTSAICSCRRKCRSRRCRIINAISRCATRRASCATNSSQSPIWKAARPTKSATATSASFGRGSRTRHSSGTAIAASDSKRAGRH